MATNLHSLRFPLGEFQFPNITIDTDEIATFIEVISDLPTELAQIIDAIPHETSYQWRYRPDGWTFSQVIHHLADSHMNSFIRFKLTLTEDEPIIRPYIESMWARTQEATNSAEIGDSLKIISGLHSRWATLLRSIKAEEYERMFRHPEFDDPISLYQSLSLYSWHCNHHLAHLRLALASGGKYGTGAS